MIKKTFTKLPNEFKLEYNSKSKKIYVYYKTKDLSDWTRANNIMLRWEKENNLKPIGAGTMISTGVRDWEYEVIDNA